MELRDLIETVTCRVLERLREEAGRPRVRVLAERGEGVAELVRRAVGDEYDLVFRGEGEGENAGGRGAGRHILPLLSCADMADLAVGRAHGASATEVLDLLLAGKPVEVLEFAYRAHQRTAPRALFALYEAHEKTLASYGLVAARERETEHFSREAVVTAETVRLAAGAGASVLAVSRAARVTPLALDTARELRIDIRKQQ